MECFHHFKQNWTELITLNFILLFFNEQYLSDGVRFEQRFQQEFLKIISAEEWKLI